jgi:putative transposon-encoded protein
MRLRCMQAKGRFFVPTSGRPAGILARIFHNPRRNRARKGAAALKWVTHIVLCKRVLRFGSSRMVEPPSLFGVHALACFRAIAA